MIKTKPDSLTSSPRDCLLTGILMKLPLFWETSNGPPSVTSPNVLRVGRKLNGFSKAPPLLIPIKRDGPTRSTTKNLGVFTFFLPPLAHQIASHTTQMDRAGALFPTNPMCPLQKVSPVRVVRGLRNLRKDHEADLPMGAEKMRILTIKRKMMTTNPLRSMRLLPLPSLIPSLLTPRMKPPLPSLFLAHSTPLMRSDRVGNESTREVQVTVGGEALPTVGGGMAAFEFIKTRFPMMKTLASPMLLVMVTISGFNRLSTSKSIEKGTSLFLARGKKARRILINLSLKQLRLKPGSMGLHSRLVLRSLDAPIIVWRKPANGAWQRFCFASRFSAGFACAATEECPLVICLEKQHYTTLRPPSREAVPKNWLRETAGIQTEQFGGAGRKKTTSENCIWSPQHQGADGLNDAASSIATPSVHTCRAPSGPQGRNNDAKVSQGTPSVHSLAHSELTPSVHTIGPASSERPLVASPSAHSGARTPSVHTLGQNSEVNIHGCSRHSVDFSGSTPTGSEPCFSNRTLLDCLPTPKRFRLTYKQQVFHESGANILDPNKVVPTHDAGRSSTIRDSRPSRQNRKCTFDWTCPICKETMTLTGHDKAARQRQRHLRTVHNSDLSQVGGSHGDRIRAGFKSRTTPSSNGACNQLRAIQRMNREKQRSDHDIRHANKDGLWPAFRKTWWCSRCLARGTTRDILGRPCNPELWFPAKAKWWLGLQPLFKQKISSFASWPSDGIQKVDAMAINLINMQPPRPPRAPHTTEKFKQKMKEQRKQWRIMNGLDNLATSSVSGKCNAKSQIQTIEYKKHQKPSQRMKAATEWVSDLCADGDIEPNPGPHRISRKKNSPP